MSRPTEDDRKTSWELIFIGGLTLLFLGLSALVLWPFGKATLTIHLAKGYGLFWAVLALTSWMIALGCRMLRVETDPPSTIYVVMNLCVSAFLQAGWSAFAALTVRNFMGASTGTTVALWAVGFVSSYVGFAIAGLFYQGTLYKLINAPLALLGYVVFAVWPAMAHSLYGWFFAIFGAG
ncbi:MAG: hypothetical protein QOC70_19 [Verrucomicrobiota bacterium]|jgi:hypothetical protein